MLMFSKSSIHQMFSKCYNWFDSLNKIISTRLSEAQIITRPAKSNGLWCCILLPTILILYNLFYEISDLYKVVSYVSLALLIYSILFIKFISISCLVLQRPIYGGCVTCGLVSSLFICISMSEGIILSLIFSISAVWAYNMLLRHMLKVMPQAFTIGEAMVVSQAVVLSLLTAFVDVFWIGAKSPVSCVVYSILSTVGLIVTVLYYIKSEYRTWRTVTVLSGVGAIYAILVLHCILGYDIIYELISSIFMDRLKRWLIATWVTLAAGAVTLVWLRTRAATKADTATRKTFHILATLVFLSGILLDLELIQLASCAAFGLLILIEACRKFDVRPFSTFLEPAFNVYCDEKEVGGWALPPLYLLAGLAGPLVLVPTSASDVERLAGVLTIGVGDSAASFFGSRYGYTTWKGTNKTVGGMLANFISQMIVLFLLKMYGCAEAQVCGAVWRGTASAAAAALTEASTDQVDNLILPLVSIIAFQLTNFVNIII